MDQEAMTMIMDQDLDMTTDRGQGMITDQDMTTGRGMTTGRDQGTTTGRGMIMDHVGMIMGLITAMQPMPMRWLP